MSDMEKGLKKTLGERLRCARKARGLTQKDLASLIAGKIDYTYIGRIERGIQLPSLKMLKKISNALSLPLSYFFEEEDKKNVFEFLPSHFKKIMKGERGKDLLKAISSIHINDIDFFIEIINLLNRHRKVSSYRGTVKEDLQLAETYTGYGEREEVIHRLRKIIYKTKRKEIKDILQNTIKELKKRGNEGNIPL